MSSKTKRRDRRGRRYGPRVRLNKFTYSCPILTENGKPKRRYTSYSTAFNEMLRLTPIMAEQGDRVVRDVYECEACHGWHLTSKGEMDEETRGRASVGDPAGAAQEGAA